MSESIKDLREAGNMHYLKKLGLSALIYSVIAMFLITLYFVNETVKHGYKYFDANEFYAATMFIFTGKFCFKGSCSTIFGVPFLATIIGVFVVFNIVTFLDRNNFVSRNVNKIMALLLPLVAVFFFVLPISAEKLIDMKFDSDRKDFNREYGFVDVISSDKRFIYPKENQILISDLYGRQKRVMVEVEDDTQIGFVSPKGNYYLSCFIDFYDGYIAFCDMIIDVKDGDRVDLCVGDILDGEMVCPTSCEWADDESKLLCSYFHRVRHGPPDPYDEGFFSLILFDLLNGIKEYVHKNDVDIYYVGHRERKRMAFIDNDSFIFIKNQMYHASCSDVKDVYIGEYKNSGVTVKKASNLQFCDGLKYHNDNLFCNFIISDSDIEIPNLNNHFVYLRSSKYENVFLISQNLEQSSKKDYELVVEIPLRSSIINLHALSDEILISGDEIININTGKLRKYHTVGSYSPEYFANIKDAKTLEDKDLFFWELDNYLYTRDQFNKNTLTTSGSYYLQNMINPKRFVEYLGD